MKLQTINELLTISMLIVFGLTVFQIQSMKTEISQLKQQVTVLSEAKAAK
jgi:hypothetical protein